MYAYCKLLSEFGSRSGEKKNIIFFTYINYFVSYYVTLNVI